MVEVIIKNPKMNVVLGLERINWVIEDMIYSFDEIDDPLYLLFWSEAKKDLTPNDKIYVSINETGEAIFLSDSRSKYSDNSLLILSKPKSNSYLGLLAFDIQNTVDDLNQIKNLLSKANLCK